MAISFVNKGTFTSGTGALSVPAPASLQSGDLLLLFVESAGQSIATPSGYTPIGDSSVASGSAAAAAGVTELHAFYKFTTGTESSLSVADSGDHTCAIILAYRGVDAQNPFTSKTASIEAAATTQSNLGGLVMREPGSWLIAAMALDRDTGSTTTLTSLNVDGSTSATERHDQTINSAAGGGLAIYDRSMAADELQIYGGVQLALADHASTITASMLFGLRAKGALVGSAGPNTLRVQTQTFPVATHPFGAFLKDRFFRWDSSATSYYTSATGATGSWTLHSSVPWSGQVVFGYGNGIFIAVRTNGTGVYSSTDGISWSLIAASTPVAHSFNRHVPYVGGFFVLSGGAYSADGVTWTTLTGARFDAFEMGGTIYGHDGDSFGSGTQYRTATAVSGTWSAATNYTSSGLLPHFFDSSGNEVLGSISRMVGARRSGTTPILVGVSDTSIYYGVQPRGYGLKSDEIIKGACYVEGVAAILSNKELLLSGPGPLFDAVPLPSPTSGKILSFHGAGAPHLMISQGATTYLVDLPTGSRASGTLSDGAAPGIVLQGSVAATATASASLSVGAGLSTPDGSIGVQQSEGSLGSERDWNAHVQAGSTHIVVSGFNATSGKESRIATSADFESWTEYTPPRNWTWSGLAVGGSYVVGVGTGQYVLYAASPYTSWNEASIATDSWQSVAYGSGRFVALASNGTRAYAAGGSAPTSWTEISDGGVLSGDTWNSLVYGAGRFICAKLLGSLIGHSTDGLTWSTYSPPWSGDTVDLYSVGSAVYALTKYDPATLATGEQSSSVWMTEDGLNWALVTPAVYQRTTFNWSRLIYDPTNGVYHIFGSDHVASSTGGSWSRNRLVGQEKFGQFGNVLRTAANELRRFGPKANFVRGRVSSANAQASAFGTLTSASASFGGSALASATASALLASPAAELGGALSAALTASAALTTSIRFASSPQCVATGSAALTTAVRLAASASAVSTATVGLTTQVRLAAAPQSSATASSALTTQIKVAAQAAAVSTVAAAASTGISLVSHPTAVVSSTATLTVPVMLGAAGFAAASASATLTSAAAQLATTATAVSAVQGELTVGVRLSAAPSSSPSATAALTTAILLDADPAAQTNTVLATLNTGVVLVGASSVVSTVTANATTAIRLNSAVAAQATSSGALTVGVLLGTTSAAQASATGALVVGALLSGSAASQSASAAALTTAIRLAASTAAASTASAGLSTQIALAGTAQAEASSTALLAVGDNLDGFATGQATATGALTTAIHLGSAAQSSATATGSVQGQAAALASAVSAQATATATVTTQARLSGSGTGTSSASAQLTTGVRLAGAASAEAIATASLAAGVTFAGSASASSAAAAADLFIAKLLEGAAAAESTADATLRVGVLIGGTALAESATDADLEASIRFVGQIVAQANALADLTQTLEQLGRSVFVLRVPADPTGMRVPAQGLGMSVAAQGGANRIGPEASDMRVASQDSDNFVIG